MGDLSSISSSDPGGPRPVRGDGRGGRGRASRRRGRGLAGAGLFAAVFVLAAGHCAFGARKTWELLRERVPPSSILESGTIHDRLVLSTPASDGAEAAAFVVGSSRVQYGFRKSLAGRRERSGLRVVKLAHPVFGAFEIRCAADSIRRFGPKVVVLGISELDTHGRIELRPGASFGNLAGIFDLIRLAGLRFALEQRNTLYQIGFGQLVDPYRYRRVLGEAGLNVLRRFPRDARHPPDSAAMGARPFVHGEMLQVATSERDALEAELERRAPGRDRAFAQGQIEHIRSITRGRHAAISKALIGRAVELLRGDHIEVVVVETPLHPQTTVLYDPSSRRDFLGFMSLLQRNFAVRFVALEEQPAYRAEDFGDLFHLADGGARKYTSVVYSAIREALRKPHAGR